MVGFKFSSIALSAALLVTSFVPSYALKLPVPMTAERPSQAVGVQYRRDREDWRRQGYHRRGDRDYYNGHRGYSERRRGYREYNGMWFPLAAFATGAIIGGAATADRPVRYGGSHVEWCANRYRSYRAYDNSYQPNNGPRRECNSPY
ncbi:BA14K family protein [Rhizobium herbae]